MKLSRFAGAAAFLCVTALAQYDQPYRPQYHFSPRVHWTNDPNGPVFFDGEYHLFFQYNPFGDLWGHMSWGHAVSPDLIHWRELPVAIREENGIMIYTGSTVVDEHNSSGFCAGGKPCMVAVYTGDGHHLETQNLAFSNDRGRTWTKYSGNPVLNLNLSDFRDPDVFWLESAHRWIMAVALPNDHKVRFYGSADLKKWQMLSEFGPAGSAAGQWECPNLFELPVEGSGETRWVLKVGVNPGALQGGSGEQYFVGRFDGTRFINENPASLTLWTDYGKDCYCALTFNHMPRGDRPVMIGWMNNWQYAAKVPTAPWRGQMTVPRRLSLRRTPEGIRLIQQPIVDSREPSKPDRHAFRLRIDAPPAAARTFHVRLLAKDGTATVVGYDAVRQEIYVDRTHSGDTAFSPDFPVRTAAPLKLGGKPLRVDILVDRCSIEVFADDGRVSITNLVFPPADASGIDFWPHHGGKVKLTRIASIW